jgi:hypothetical protein
LPQQFAADFLLTLKQALIGAAINTLFDCSQTKILAINDFLLQPRLAMFNFIAAAFLQCICRDAFLVRELIITAALTKTPLPLIAQQHCAEPLLAQNPACAALAAPSHCGKSFDTPNKAETNPTTRPLGRGYKENLTS